MTNYERIKSMSIGEVSKILSCPTCALREMDCSQQAMGCDEAKKKWLNAEAEPTRWEKWIDDINVKGKPPNGNVPGMRRNYRDK